MDEFWELGPASFRRLQNQRLRFDLVGATGVTLRIANLEKMVGQTMAVIAEHNAKHDIELTSEELAEVETRVRDTFDEGYFGSHLPRLTGFNGMQLGLPWLRRILPQPSRFHGPQVSNIKSSLDVRLILVPSGNATLARGTDATMMGRRHHVTDTQEKKGYYFNLFTSLILGPQLRIGDLGADDPQSEDFNAIGLMVEGRGNIEKFWETHTAISADEFTMREVLRGGLSVGSYSPAVQLTYNTRFSKQKADSITRTFFLGDGTTQLEMPASPCMRA